MVVRRLFHRAVVAAALVVVFMAGGAAMAAPSTLLWGAAAVRLSDAYTQEQGLAQDFTTAIAQDHEGFLWVGTPGGLERFDGYHFKTYQSTDSQPGILPDNYIKALYIDERGVLWAGTDIGGVVRYDASQDRFERVGGGALSRVGVSAIDGDGEGGLWIGSFAGLEHYDPARDAVQRVALGGDAAAEPAMEQVRAVKRDRRGGLFVGTASGLMYRPPAGGPFQALPLPALGTGGRAVGVVVEDSAGRLWVGTDHHGVAVFQYDTGGVLRPVPPPAGLGSAGLDGLAKTWIRAMVEVRPGLMWIGTVGAGVWEVDVDTGRIEVIRHSPLVQASLVNDNVGALLRDASGLVWVGTYRGLCRFDPSAAAFRALFPTRPDDVGGPALSDSAASALALAPDGYLWVGRAESGVDVWDAHGNRAARILPDTSRMGTPAPGNMIRAFAFQNANTGRDVLSGAADVGAMAVWIGTRAGLFRTDARGGGLRKVALPSLGADPDVKALLPDGADLWVGTYNAGLVRLDTVTGATRIYRSSDGTLSDNRINAVIEADARSLWVSTRSGLFRLDKDSGTPTPVPVRDGDPLSRPKAAIVDMVRDTRSRLWTATYGGGIAVMIGEDEQGTPRFRTLTTRDGLPSNTVSALQIDATGAVWGATGGGLARIDPDTFEIRAYRRGDGLRLRDHWPRATVRAPDGEVLFGTEDGITAVQPTLVEDWIYDAPLVMTAARVGERDVPVQALRTGGARQGTAALTILPGDHGFSLEVAALDFSAPERNRYAYKLEGWDRDWVLVDADRRQITYNGLEPGKYRLRVKGSNRNGVWSKTELSIPVRVLPAWYRTWWFKTLEVAALVALALLGLRVRTAFLRRRQRELEELVQQRTQELTHLASTLRRLGDAGQEITATLIRGSVFETLRRYVRELLGAHHLSLFRVQADSVDLAASDGAEDALSIPLDDPASPIARTVAERREVMRDRDDGGQTLAMPLMVESRVLGVLQVHLDEPSSDRDRMIFRNLCAYGAVALENAEAYQRAEAAWVETAQALTDLRATQARLVQQEKMASLGRLVAGVAHEVNTPLGVVLTAAGTLRADVEEFRDAVARGRITRATLERGIDEWTGLADLVERNTQRAAALIKSFSSVAVKDGDDKVVEVDLSTLLADMVRLAGNGFDPDLVSIALDIPYGLVVRTLPDSLMDVISRIMGNIADHAFAPGQRGRITVSAQEEGGVEGAEVAIRITDDGRGIPADVLSSVLDPFYTTARSRGHPGLGLHVAYNQVTQRLRGSLSVDSQEGQGTTVTIRLPALITAPAD